MSGNGTPTTGKIPTTIPRLINTDKINVNAKLPDNNRPKLSCALTLIYQQRLKIIKNKIKIPAHPISPNSSPDTAKIKSVVCAGKKDKCDCVPCRYPLPINP